MLEGASILRTVANRRLSVRFRTRPRSVNKLTALIQGNDAFLRAAMSIPRHLLSNRDGKCASGFVI
jgi:hypothetical protein